LVKESYLGCTVLEIALFFQFFGFFNFGDLFQIYTKNMKIYKNFQKRFVATMQIFSKKQNIGT